MKRLNNLKKNEKLMEFIVWGQETYDPAHALLGPRARAEEGICRGRMGEGRDAGAQPRMTLSSALQDFKEKSNISLKAAPKKPPEGGASRMGTTWGYNAKLVRGEYVPSALNAHANVLTMLMRKDAWTE